METPKKRTKKEDDILSSNLVWVIGIAAVLILFNQIQLFQLNSALGITAGNAGFLRTATTVTHLSNGDLDSVNVNEIQSTAQAIAATMDLSGITDAQSAVDAMVPTGTPDYGAELGISYDDPLTALNFLARELYPRSNQEIQKNPEQWKRFLNLAAQPRGISCEFCCGVGPIGVTPDGQLRCGCQHNPAIVALTQYLIMYTDMNDAEILREAMRWKTLWFPRNMVQLGMQIAGGDSSVLADVPQMVGGC